MKNNWLIVMSLFFLFGTQVLKAQDDTGQQGPANGFNYENELRRMIQFPNSPEAQAFTKYGNVAVNMYSGSPNISVPIYTISGREVDVPLSLSYDASGIKVEQLANNVGLGWNLNVGGRISRVANGAPDDYILASPSSYQTCFNTEVNQGIQNYINENYNFPTSEAVVDYFEFLNKINKNQYDTQPDFFSLNVLGINDYVVFDLTTMEPRTLNNPRIKVEATIQVFGTEQIHNITDWKVTNEDGTEFYFESAEVTRTEGNDQYESFVYGGIKEYNSSWVLTKIISPNQKDIYDFNYYQTPFWTQNMSVSGASSTTFVINSNTPYENSAPWTDLTFSPTYKIKQQVLTSIYHNGVERVVTTHENRFDLSASKAISEINIKKNDGTFLQKFKFNYSYFGIDSGVNPATQNSYSIRLKLDRLDLRSGSDQDYKSYNFEYINPENLPPVHSRAQDYLGYYNDANNTVMYPTAKVGEYTLQGANRSINASVSQNGLLHKMYYPTGGHTEFQYEQHTTPATQEDIDDNMQQQTVAYQFLSGGDTGVDCNNSEALCGCSDGWCLDNYGMTQPKIKHGVFKIEESGTYNLKFWTAGSGGFGTFTAVFKKDCILSKPALPQPTPIEQILDLTSTGNLLIAPDDMVFEENLYNNLDVNGEREVFLEAGCYQITMINPNPNETLFLSISGFVSTLNDALLNNYPRAGLRVKQITDFDATNSIASQRAFRYQTEFNSGVSSGEMLFTPKFYSTDGSYELTGMQATNGEICDIIDGGTIVRLYANSSGGSTPHVAYGRVYEIQKGEQQITNGYTQHDFYMKNHAGLWSTGAPPNISFYTPKPANAQPSLTTVFNNSGEKVSESSTVYNELGEGTPFFGTKGIYITNDYTKQYAMLFVRALNDGTYTYAFDNWQRGYLSVGENNYQGCAWFPPQAYDDETDDLQPVWTSFTPSFKMHQTLAQGRVGYPILKTSTQFFGSEATTSTTEFNYDAANDYLLRSQSVTTSDSDETRSQIFYYPKDLVNTAPTYQSMVNKNMIAVPVQEEHYINNSETATATKLFTKTTAYQDIYSFTLPMDIKVSKGNDATETRLEYHKISPQGNPQEASQTDGTHSIYIWGYNNRLPIAKIENATYDGMPNDVLLLISQIRIASNTEYNDADEAALRAQFNTLRAQSYFSNSLITTYTYDPLVGVTSTTDPRGQTVYYEYDTFNRLKQVKDQDGNIVGQNEYNYRTQN